MKRNLELEATIVEKYVAVESFLDERSRRLWTAAESRAIGYGGDALVSCATGLSRTTIRAGRKQLESGVKPPNVWAEFTAPGQSRGRMAGPEQALACVMGNRAVSSE